MSVLHLVRGPGKLPNCLPTMVDNKPGPDLAVAADRCQSLMQRPEQKAGVEAQADHLEILLEPLGQIGGPSRHDSAVLARQPDCILESKQLSPDAGPFPKPAKSG